MCEKRKFYIPVCLYPHTKYRTADGLGSLFSKFALSYNAYIIVIADRLLALDNLVTGRFFSKESVYRKARREAEQVHALIKRSARRANALDRGAIVFWDEIAGTEPFISFSKKLTLACLEEKEFAETLRDFIERRVQRFGLGISRFDERKYELDYLMSEVCMSVYCTEMLGHWTEIWERPPAKDAPDPLKVLYTNHKDLVERVVGHTTRRQLEFLFE